MTGILVAVLLFSAQLPPSAAWERANRDTKRIEPAALVGIPDWIRTELVRLRCAIPQVWGATGQGNVIRGRFNDGPAVDWAVLCSRDLSSTILVFWDGRATSIAEVASTLDATFLQVVMGGGRSGFREPSTSRRQWPSENMRGTPVDPGYPRLIMTGSTMRSLERLL